MDSFYTKYYVYLYHSAVKSSIVICQKMLIYCNIISDSSSGCKDLY